MKTFKVILLSFLAFLLTITAFGQWTYPNSATISTTDNVGIGTTTPSYKLQAQGDIYANGGWFRVSGARGLYFQSYGGGFYMVDNTWIRTFGSKNFYHNTGIMRTDGTLQVGPSGNRFVVNTNGRVGVGTTAPAYKLHAQGDIYADGGWFRVSGARGLYFQSYGGGLYMVDNTWIRTYGNKNFYHNTGIMRTDGTFHVGPNGNRLLVHANGNIGIGTTTPDNKLDVNGTARAKEVRVQTGWSDYVFYDDYDLPTLQEEEQHIEAKGHLLGFESEADMNGEVQLGDVTKRQQAKIEELMLHVIRQQKEIEALKAGLEALQN